MITNVIKRILMDMFEQADSILDSIENELSAESYYHRGYIQAIKDVTFIISKYDLLLEDADRAIAKAEAIEEKSEEYEDRGWLDRLFGNDVRGMDKD